MAGDRSQVGKILADIDAKIQALQQARALVVAARPQRKSSVRRVAKPPKEDAA